MVELMYENIQDKDFVYCVLMFTKVYKDLLSAKYFDIFKILCKHQ